MRRSAEGSDEDTYEDEVGDDAHRHPAAYHDDKPDDGPACQACRRKKAKCSRGRPCSHCSRYNLDCIYDEKKSRPGMRIGAVELLNQRVATLENMFLGQGLLWQQVWRCLDTMNQASPSPGKDAQRNATLQEHTAKLKHTLSSLHVDGSGDIPTTQATSSSKRQKTVKDVPSGKQYDVFWMRNGRLELPDDLVDSLVEIYFERIQPWIPILHVLRFQENMKIPQERQKMTVIFQAIGSLCSRFSNDTRLVDHHLRLRLAKECRQAVILASMESFSVETLQALIICAFDTIGSGRGPSAWSIVGSMARTVEQLQLNIEDDDTHQPRKDSKSLITRIAFLHPCQDWAEEEGRRRVFWNVFLMDRFCSIATGWNLSLKSAEVKRRLPCEGALWRTGELLARPTPFFGIEEQAEKTSESLLTLGSGTEDPTSLGGLSYCIEATESLSLITSFFLRQAVDVKDMQSVRLWLLRFKQLDLRLVQWKTFLPERWREACARNAEGNMDPNLTLAHMTHNTAIVLLHQGIAYPSSDWQAASIRLPSTSSAETCSTAAREVAIIADRFLQDGDFLTNPQFAFCLFICGRMFLAHEAYYGVDWSREFDVLLSSLREVSRRWNGPHFDPAAQNSGDNLASKFACRLAEARQMGPTTLDIRQAACSDDRVQTNVQATVSSTTGVAENAMQPKSYDDLDATRHYPNATPGTRILNNWERQTGSYHKAQTDLGASPDSISLAFPPLPMAFQVPSAPVTTMHSPNHATLGQLPNEEPLQFDHGAVGFEELNTFFNYHFLPDQRVSMFEQLTGQVPPEDNNI